MGIDTVHQIEMDSRAVAFPSAPVRLGWPFRLAEDGTPCRLLFKITVVASTCVQRLECVDWMSVVFGTCSHQFSPGKQN